MKTLLERLNPEIATNLYDEQVKYPITVGDLLTKLSKNVAVTELTLNELNNLSSFSPKPVIKILDLYDMFENI
jgi:hypothetical protein